MHTQLDDGERWALIDCDDVLLDYIGGFREFLNRTLKKNLVGLPDSWDMSKWAGTTSEEILELINQFNETDIGFEKLKPFDGAVRGVKILKALGFQVAIVTSSSAHPSSVERRAKNITSVFGDTVDRLHIVALGQSKESILGLYKNAIWIEDNVKNAAIGAGLGHRAFLVKAGHNQNVHGLGQNDPGVVHVQGWADIIPHIVNLIPNVRQALGVREASLNALERASQEAKHGHWTPRNPQSEAMKKLVECGVINLTEHSGRKPTAELTDIGFAVLGLDPKIESPTRDNEFDI